MVSRSVVAVLCWCGLLLIGASAGAHGAEPLTTVTARAEQPLTPAPGPFEDVVRSLVTLDAPLPADVTQAPAACQQLRYLRYHRRGGPDDPQQADGVFVSMPGVLGGAGSLAMHGLQVVQNGADQGRSLEYWALDRRPNCLEDRTGIDAAERAGNAGPAIDYYLNGQEMDGRRFAGFPGPGALPWVPDAFDLRQILEDYRAVIVDGIPDPEVRRARVFCGGHSLGGLLAGLMMAWDFDGDPRTTADAGYDLCAGGVGLDTLVTADLFRLHTRPSWEQLLVNRAVSGSFGQTNLSIASGASPAVIDLDVVNPEIITTLSALALEADLHPDDDVAPLLARVPDTGAIEKAMRYFVAETGSDFYGPVARLRTLHLTGRAALGAFLDDNSQPVSILKASIGNFDRGPVAPKQFPLAFEGAKSMPPLLGRLYGVAQGTSPGLVPTAEDQLYGWRNYDEELPDLRKPDGQPYTSSASEVTDIADFARLLHEGPLDFAESYFSTRVISDAAFALIGARAGELRHIRYPRVVRTKPRLTLWGGDSLTQSLRGWGISDIPRDVVTLPGYDHLDIVTASPRQNNGEPEQSAALTTAFMLANAR